MSMFNAYIYDKDYAKQTQTAFQKLLSVDDSFSFLNTDEYIVFPGFCDVHVHFREPGFFYKETIATGSRAAARGGYTDVCTMPNLNPVPDTLENLKLQKSVIDIDSVINIHPYGTITMGQKGTELSDMEKMSSGVVAFSDDGRGVQDPGLMKEAMLKAKSLGKAIVAHCEDNSLLKGGYIHDGQYCREHGHMGICSESEWKPIERDIQLAKDTGCAYHVCHISCKESVELIRQAKKDGIDITCETGPHYLILDDSNLQEDGRFKMNPPLRDKSDRLALLEGMYDGTIDMIATDHAPHSEREKSKGLKDSLFGIVGIETAFQLMYTKFVRTGDISLKRLITMMSVAPRERFNIPMTNGITVWDLDRVTTIRSSDFISKGKSTPFENVGVYGKCMLTYCNSRIAYREKF